MPPYFFTSKTPRKSPLPTLGSTFYIFSQDHDTSKKIDFWNVDTPKPENADQNVQTDHLTGHATDQTFFHI